MSYKVKGVITAITEVKTLDNGASVLDYTVEVTEENGYKTPHSFNMYKKPEYKEHIENFVKFNSVGDSVEVEFTIRGQEYNGKIYNSLNHWRCDTLTESTPVETEKEDLPF
jgi:hypothetical protein